MFLSHCSKLTLFLRVELFAVFEFLIVSFMHIIMYVFLFAAVFIVDACYYYYYKVLVFCVIRNISYGEVW